MLYQYEDFFLFSHDFNSNDEFKNHSKNPKIKTIELTWYVILLYLDFFLYSFENHKFLITLHIITMASEI